MPHPLGAARLEVVVRTWRRIEEAAESNFGRGKRLRSARNYRVWFLVDLVLATFTQCHSTSLSSLPANFSFSPFLTFQLFDPDFQSHAPLIDLNYASYNNPSCDSRFHIMGLFFRGPNSYRTNFGPRLHCSYVWYSYHANVYVSAVQSALNG